MYPEPEQLSRFLVLLAGIAGGVMQKHFSPKGVRFERKQDGTPVTIADREIGRMVDSQVNEIFPYATLIREEADMPFRKGGLEFIIDELDGTKAFSEGIPVSVFAAAALIEHQLQAAVISAPLSKISPTIRAVRGEGAFAGNTRICVSDAPLCGKSVAVATALAPNELYASGPLIEELRRGGREVFDVRSISNSCAYLLATGDIEGVLFPWQSLHDMAAADLIVREAGGVSADLDGKPLDFSRNTIHGFVMANNRCTLNELLKIVSKHRQ